MPEDCLENESGEADFGDVGLVCLFWDPSEIPPMEKDILAAHKIDRAWNSYELYSQDVFPSDESICIAQSKADHALRIYASSSHETDYETWFYGRIYGFSRH